MTASTSTISTTTTATASSGGAGRGGGSGSVRDGAFRFLEVVHENGFRLRGNIDPEEKQSLAEGEEEVGAEKLTQAVVARRAGLSRPSVAAYARRLRGRVLRDDVLAIRSGSGFAIGVDFSETHGTRVALGNITGKIVKILPDGPEPAKLVREPPEQAIETAHSAILRLLDEYDLRDRQPIGVGIGLPGPVRDGQLIGRGRTRWDDRKPERELAELLGWEDVAFETQSDTYLSALAEGMWGSGRVVDDSMLYVKWSAALRSAIVIKGDLHTGHTGTAGELPHIVVDPELEEVCETCGQEGCLHVIASLPRIGARISSREGKEDLRLRATHVVAAMDETEETARELKLAAEAIGKAIRPIVDSLDPKSVVIGGALGSRAFERLEEPLYRGLNSLLPHDELEVELRGGRLRHRTAVCGATALALLRFTPAYLRLIAAG